MNSDIVFSWAEDANGRLVHVDSVPRGLNCRCRCPYCHEPVVARQGEIKEHGFAHHSGTRQARLEMCYMVTMYKLAEQIIQEQKHLQLPSYHGIFPSKEVIFTDVKVDGSFERMDKQPDVIATCADGTCYLIEFTFQYKVQHKQPIDYSNTNCIEIDLSNQSLETIRTFLSSRPTSDWKWINNDLYFNSIEDRYAHDGKAVDLVCEEDCQQCNLSGNCCAVRSRQSYDILRIENNGEMFRLCKTEIFNDRLEALLEQRHREEQRLHEEKMRELQRQKEEQELKERLRKEQEERLKRLENPAMRTCFDCTANLRWANYGGFASCGCYQSLGVPKSTPPDQAQKCPRFEPILI